MFRRKSFLFIAAIAGLSAVTITYQNCGPEFYKERLSSEVPSEGRFRPLCSASPEVCCYELGGSWCEGGGGIRGGIDLGGACPNDGYGPLREGMLEGCIDDEGQGVPPQNPYINTVCSRFAFLPLSHHQSSLDRAVGAAKIRILNHPACERYLAADPKELEDEFFKRWIDGGGTLEGAYLMITRDPTLLDPYMKKDPLNILHTAKMKIITPEMSPFTSEDGYVDLDCNSTEASRNGAAAAIKELGTGSNSEIRFFPNFFSSEWVFDDCQVLLVLHEVAHATHSRPTHVGRGGTDNFDRGVLAACNLTCRRIPEGPIPQSPGDPRPNVAVAFHVVDDSTGLPIRNAFVQVGGFRGLTNSEGRVSGNIPVADYKTKIFHSDFYFFDTTYEHRFSNQITVRLQAKGPDPLRDAGVPDPLPDISQRSSQLEVTVINNGRPIHGAKVDFGTTMATTDVHGRVSGILPNAKYNGNFSAYGYNSLFKTFGHNADQNLTIHLTSTNEAILIPSSTPIRTVNITKVGGDGFIFGSYGNPICDGSSCVYRDHDGRHLSFSVIAKPGYRFTGWAGGANCSKLGAGMINLESDMNCVANFTVGTAAPKACLSPGSICGNRDTACNGPAIGYKCEQCCGYSPNNPHVEIYGCQDYTHYCLGQAVPSTSASLSMDQPRIPPGGLGRVSWSNSFTPTTTDWIGIYHAGKKDSDPYVDYFYLSSCTKIEGEFPRALGICGLSELPLGSYELRIFHANTFVRLGPPLKFQVATPIPPTVLPPPYDATKPGILFSGGTTGKQNLLPTFPNFSLTTPGAYSISVTHPMFVTAHGVAAGAYGSSTVGVYGGGGGGGGACTTRLGIPVNLIPGRTYTLKIGASTIDGTGETSLLDTTSSTYVFRLGGGSRAFGQNGGAGGVCLNGDCELGSAGGNGGYTYEPGLQGKSNSNCTGGGGGGGGSGDWSSQGSGGAGGAGGGGMTEANTSGGAGSNGPEFTGSTGGAGGGGWTKPFVAGGFYGGGGGGAAGGGGTIGGVGKSGAFAVQLVPDTTNPVVILTALPISAAANTKVTFKASASDENQVSKVEFLVNGATVCTDTLAPYACPWTLPSEVGASYKVLARAHDSSGNSTQTPFRLITSVADTVLPTVQVTAPIAGSIVVPNVSITIKAKASDNARVSKVEFYVNDSLKCNDSTSAFSCNWKPPSGTNINYRLKATAHDVNGNAKMSSIVTVRSQ